MKNEEEQITWLITNLYHSSQTTSFAEVTSNVCYHHQLNSVELEYLFFPKVTEKELVTNNERTRIINGTLRRNIQNSKRNYKQIQEENQTVKTGV